MLDLVFLAFMNLRLIFILQNANNPFPGEAELCSALLYLLQQRIMNECLQQALPGELQFEG